MGLVTAHVVDVDVMGSDGVWALDKKYRGLPESYQMLHALS